MTYNKRSDGRKFDELRPIKAEVGVIPRAEGSARFQIGKTVAVAAVYGPRPLFPKFLKNNERGVLRCYYNMLSFSGSGERVRPGPSRRSKEIGLVTEKALAPALDLTAFPGSTIDVFIELVQTDAGTRCAGITAAAMALADAGFPMKDLVSAIAVGRIDDKIVIDVDKSEEDYEGGMADISIAMMPRTGQVTMLQMDGYLKRDELREVLKTAQKACAEIYKNQKEAFEARYTK
mgnify:CR=1 FL=1